MQRNFTEKFLPFALLSLVLFGSCSQTKELTTDVSKGQETESGTVHRADQNVLKSEGKLIEAASAAVVDDFEEAVKLYKEAIKVDSKNDAASYELARIYFENQLFELSKEYISNAIDLDPKNKWYLGLYAEILTRMDDYKEAVKVYELLIEKFPGEMSYYFDLAFMYIKLDKSEDAIKVYDKYENNFGLDESIVRQKQRLYLKEGNIDKAAEEVQRLIDRNPKEIKYRGMLAEIYEANDMNDKAMEIYHEMLELDPGSPYPMLALADLYNKKGDQDKYLEYLKKAFGHDKLSADDKVRMLFPYLNWVEGDEEKRAEAFELAEIFIATHPNDAKAFALYGDLLYRATEDEKALEQYQNSIELDESIFSVWQQTFYIQAGLQHYEDLLQNCKDALELFPNQPLIYFFQGVSNNQLKRFDEAVAILNIGVHMVVDNKPLLAQMYANLGDAYHSLEEHMMSDSSYEQSLRNDPDNAFVLNNYSYYLSVRNENLPRALEMSKRSNELVEANSAFLDTYAWIMYRMGDYEESKTYMEKALKAGGNERPVILEHYGDVLFQLGDLNGAVEYWNKARDKGLVSDNIDRKIADRKLYD